MTLVLLLVVGVALAGLMFGGRAPRPTGTGHRTNTGLLEPGGVGIFGAHGFFGLDPYTAPPGEVVGTSPVTNFFFPPIKQGDVRGDWSWFW